MFLFKEKLNILSGKKLHIAIVSLFILIGLNGPLQAEKSLYVISDTEMSQIQAYKIEGTTLIWQDSYICYSNPSGDYGSVALALDESEYGQFLFVTFENKSTIELVNAETMRYVDIITSPGANNLAGIAIDAGKGKLYAVDRYTNHLYSWSWDPSNKTLSPDFNDPYYIALEDLQCNGDSIGAFGIALDYENNLLYVADNTNSIKYYDTNNWSKVGEVNDVSCNVISVAIDVNNQLLYYGSMGDYGEGNVNLYQYDISTQTEDSTYIGSSVAGIVVDQDSFLVYFTTFEDGSMVTRDRLFIYDVNLVYQPWESGDIGNPAGLCVPAGDVFYKPPLLHLEKLVANEPNCVIAGDFLTYTINYTNPPFGDPNYVGNVNDVVITDYLTDDLDFNSASGPNSVYDSGTHTVTWNIGSLEPNESNSVSLTVKVNDCILGCGTIANFCDAKSDSTYNIVEVTFPLCCASSPLPSCESIIDWDTGELNLTWCPGLFAADVNGHEVYFGSSFSDVKDANNSDPNVYKGMVTNPSYPVDFNTLEVDTTYYWRIDEVNISHQEVRWKSGVWSFHTWNYFIVENFDSYPSQSAMRVAWKDYHENGTGAEVHLADNLARNGNSVQYEFWNNYSPYYSEAYADIDNLPSSIGSDWTAGGVESLSLWFYGQPDNAASEQMYIKLTDGNSNSTIVMYNGDMNDVTEPQWHQWNIVLQDFADDNDVNLADVSRITVGFGDGSVGSYGQVYFDDIRLYLERCIPGYYPAGDFESDCDVDFDDFAFLSLAWLTSSQQPLYNPTCDISVPGDGLINEYDLARFCDYWLWQEN